MWQVQGSNLRRLSRRFYRPLPLATRATCLECGDGAPRRMTEDSGRAALTRNRLIPRLGRVALTSERHGSEHWATTVGTAKLGRCHREQRAAIDEQSARTHRAKTVLGGASARGR